MNEDPRVPNKLAMPASPRSILALLLLIAAAWCAPLAPAHAQFGLGRSVQNPDDPQFAAGVGFGAGLLWPNRWLPVTITLTGGAKPFDGAVAISYSQDDRNGAQIVRRVTATPGKTSTFGALVNLPPACSHITVTLRTKSGHEVRRIEFDSFADPSRGEVPLTRPAASSPLVLALGDPGSSALMSVRALKDDNGDRHALGVATPLINMVPASSIPPTWAALDSVLLLVADADAAPGCDPRVLAAIREWVSSGGRLVVLANGPGDTWRDWLASSPSAPAPVDVGPSRSTPVPADLAGTLQSRPPRVMESPIRQGETRDATPATPAEHFAPRPSIAARPIALTNHGERQGWKLRYLAEGEPSGGLVAEGPLGFGWVVVVGFDPQLVASTPQRDASACVWYALLDTALSDWRSRPKSSTPYGYAADGHSSGSPFKLDSQSTLALDSALNKISDVPTASHSVFPVLATGMVLMALLLGPVDALVLRKLGARHRSWATAIGWITLSSLAAYFVPSVARSGASRVNRLSVVDAMQEGPDPASPALAWRTSITGVFAGASMLEPFQGAPAGSWWKSCSSLQDQSFGRRENMAPRKSLAAVQSLPDLTTLGVHDDPWGGFGERQEGTGGNIPAPIAFQLWTFRTFEDRGRTATTIRARVRRDWPAIKPAWKVELHGVPAGATIRSAVLRVPEATDQRWHELAFSNAADHLEATSDEGSADPPSAWTPPAPDSSSGRPWWVHAQTTSYHASHAFLLPGIDRHDLAITQALQHDRAVLYLLIDNMPPEVTLKSSATYQHTEVLRLIVPLSHDGDAPPSAPAEVLPAENTK